MTYVCGRCGTFDSKDASLATCPYCGDEVVVAEIREGCLFVIVLSVVFWITVIWGVIQLWHLMI